MGQVKVCIMWSVYLTFRVINEKSVYNVTNAFCRLCLIAIPFHEWWKLNSVNYLIIYKIYFFLFTKTKIWFRIFLLFPSSRRWQKLAGISMAEWRNMLLNCSCCDRDLDWSKVHLNHWEFGLCTYGTSC